jgi:hypothetical protein
MIQEQPTNRYATLKDGGTRYPLLETEKARYRTVVTRSYSPITGGMMMETSLVREEKDASKEAKTS